MSGAKAPVGIAFRIIKAHKPFHLINVAVPQEGWI
jgi:hypothetical protein